MYCNHGYKVQTLLQTSTTLLYFFLINIRLFITNQGIYGFKQSKQAKLNKNDLVIVSSKPN